MKTQRNARFKLYLHFYCLSGEVVVGNTLLMIVIPEGGEREYMHFKRVGYSDDEIWLPYSDGHDSELMHVDAEPGVVVVRIGDIEGTVRCRLLVHLVGRSQVSVRLVSHALCVPKTGGNLIFLGVHWSISKGLVTIRHTSTN